MKPLFKFFTGMNPLKTAEVLADPISLRLPKSLLEQIENQADEIGGARYRSKHLINLLKIGADYYSTQSERLKALPLDQFALVMRLNYVFYKLDLQPSVIAEEWKMPDVSQWNNWLEGRELPSFDALNRLALEHYVDATWLKHGHYSGDTSLAPFIVERPDIFPNSFYKMFKYVFGLHEGKVRMLHIIRSKESGQILLSLQYGDNAFITIDFSQGRFNLLNAEQIDGMSLDYAKEFAKLCCLFDSCAVYGKGIETKYVSLGEADFQILKEGRENPHTLQSSRFAENEAWGHLICDHSMTLPMDEGRVWKGGKELFLKIQQQDGFQRDIELIKKILIASDGELYDSIEQFKDFHERYTEEVA